MLITIAGSRMRVILSKDRVLYKETYEKAHSENKFYQDKNQGMALKKFWEPEVELESPILEVGCGNGKLCEYLVERGFRVVGGDVAAGPYNRDGYEFVQFDVTYTWPFDTGEFVYGLAFDVFEHLHKEDLHVAFSELLRVSKYQVLSIPDYLDGSYHLIGESAERWMRNLDKIGTNVWRRVLTLNRGKNKKVNIFVRE